MTTIISIRVKAEVGGRRWEISALRPCADECGGRNGECRARVEPAMVGFVTGIWGKWIRGTHKIHVFHRKSKQKASSFQDFNNDSTTGGPLVSERHRAWSTEHGAGEQGLRLKLSANGTG